MKKPSATLFRLSLFSAGLALALGGSGIVLAQDSDAKAKHEGKLAIEEVTVTGTKRDIAQQDVAIAVSTLTATQIDRTFRNDVTALTQLAPNVNITMQNGFNAVAGGIRGTGFISILVTKDSSTGILVDEFAFNHVQSQFVEMFDIDQVEVYRGPQGTLFGKNTTGGAISFTTKKPVLGELFGEVEGTYGQYASNDAEAKKINFALNVPLGETLAARLTVIKDFAEGYYTNDKPMGGTFLCFACDGEGQATTEEIYTKYPTTGDGKKIGGKNVLAAKLKFRWQPNDMYTADLTWEYVEDRSDTVAAANETPGNEAYVWPLIGFPGIHDAGWKDPFRTGQTYTQTAAIDMNGGHQIDADGYYLNQTFAFGNFVFKSITGYREQDEVLASTYTGEAYTSLYDASRNSLRDSFQQEFRLTSEFDGPFNFVAGAGYYTDDVEFVVFGNLGFFAPLAGTKFYNERYEIQWTTQDRTSWAGYFDASYDVTDKLTLTGGYRYTKDKKDFVRMSLGTAANPVSNIIDIYQFQGPHINPLPESAFGNVVRNKKTWDADTYRVVLDYAWSDNLMTYASYATGFVAGGFSETCGSATSCAAYAPEKNDNWEIGLKSDLLDGTLRLNLALFQTQYKNLQRDTVVTFFDAAGNRFQETRAVNVGKSTAKGAEVELNWVPIDALRFDLNFGYLDHEYDSYSPGIDPADLGLTGDPRPFDLSSLEPPFSPKYNLGIGATYFHDISSGGSLTFNASMHYQDEYETSSFPANGQGADASGNPIILQKAYTQVEERTLVDAFITWQTPNESLDVTVFGKNLTDETWRQSANPVATLWNFTRYGPPRFIGIQLGYKF